MHETVDLGGWRQAEPLQDENVRPAYLVEGEGGTGPGGRSLSSEPRRMRVRGVRGPHRKSQTPQSLPPLARRPRRASRGTHDNTTGKCASALNNGLMSLAYTTLHDQPDKDTVTQQQAWYADTTITNCTMMNYTGAWNKDLCRRRQWKSCKTHARESVLPSNSTSGARGIIILGDRGWASAYQIYPNQNPANPNS